MHLSDLEYFEPVSNTTEDIRGGYRLPSRQRWTRVSYRQDFEVRADQYNNRPDMVRLQVNLPNKAIKISVYF